MVGSISGNYSIDFKVCLAKTSNENVIQDLKKVSDIIDNLISETQPTELLEEPNSDDVVGVPDLSNGGFDICNSCGAIYVGGSPTICARCGNSMEEPQENDSTENEFSQNEISETTDISENVEIESSTFFDGIM